MENVINKYKCYRCDYETKDKNNMRRHLYNLKKKCKAKSYEQDIELTDAIKEKILENRVYYKPVLETAVSVPSVTTNNNTTINNTTINNMIVSMDVVEKIRYLSDYTKCRMKCIEGKLYRRYNEKISLFESGEVDIRMQEKDFYDIVDNMTTFKNISELQDMNIVYDIETKKLKLYEGSNIWLEEMIEFGIIKLIDIIHENYLFTYEMYLIRKIYGEGVNNLREKSEYRKALENYYKFIGIFDVKPYCLEKTNGEILGITDLSYSIEESCQSIYDKIAVPKCEMRNTKKLLIDLIKTNSKNSIKELNKIILDTIKVDKEFKEKILDGKI